jgi:hypothetical protein
VFEYIGKITGVKAVAIAEHKEIPTISGVAAARNSSSAAQGAEL